MSAISLKVGFDVLRSYRRLAYAPWYALAEFIDNSTQSYFDNKGLLDAAYKKESTGLIVEIAYDRTAGTLTVKDNAMGMSIDDLRAAVHLGKPPAIATGRSQFGLGMKTAAGWFGDLWSVIGLRSTLRRSLPMKKQCSHTNHSKRRAKSTSQ